MTDLNSEESGKYLLKHSLYVSWSKRALEVSCYSFFVVSSLKPVFSGHLHSRYSGALGLPLQGEVGKQHSHSCCVCVYKIDHKNMCQFGYCKFIHTKPETDNK